MINFLQEFDSYSFIKAAVGLLAGGALLGLFSYGYVLLKRDKNQLISESDFRLYLITYIQVFLLIAEWSIIQVSLIEYPFRIIKLVLNISISVTFLYYILDEIHTQSIDKAFKFSISGAGILLVFMLFGKNSNEDCGQNFWELYDLAYLSSSIIIVYVGSKAISEITTMENQNMNQPSDPIAKQISLQLIRNQKNNYFLMVVGVLLGCLLFIMMDLLKFFAADNSISCENMFIEKSIWMKVLLVLTEFAANVVPMVTIFYVYVAKNWSLLDYNKKQDLSISEACDSIRSRMIYEREMEDFNKYGDEKEHAEFKITF